MAQNAGFSTLVKLVTDAGLGGALSGPGPFTVFAPTNKAFAKLPKATRDALAADVELLKTVLTFHVVPGLVKSSDLSNELVADSLQGSPLRFNKYNEDQCTRRARYIRSAEAGWGRYSSSSSRGGVSPRRGSAPRTARAAPFFTVNGKRIVQADVPANNGVIHVVDEVIFPLSDKTLVEQLAGNPDFSTLVTAVQAAGLVDTLNGGPFTVFAPTNAAFAKIPPTTLNGLLQDKPALTKILLRHVVPATVFANGIPCSTSVTTAGNDKLQVTKSTRGVRVTSNVDGKRTMASVVQADVIASNGVAHAIDMVI